MTSRTLLSRVRGRAAAGLVAAAGRLSPVASAAPVAPGTPGGSAKGPKKPREARPVPRQETEPGARKASLFFDEYPRFYETSHTSPSSERLNLRYEAIFAENREVLHGARVLDISSHDGRWSLAALRTGAASVVGVEARPELVELAKENMVHYEVDPASYSFIAGDVFDVLAKRPPEVDVVMCLGFLYHTLRYNELLFRIAELKPRQIILDTEVALQTGKLIRIQRERAEIERNAAVDDFTVGGQVLVGKPSIAALRLMMSSYGYEVERFSDWPGLLRDNPEMNNQAVDDYRRTARVTLVCTATS